MQKFFTFFLIFLSSLAIYAQNSVSASAGNEGGVEEHRYEGMSITYAPVVESADVFSSVSYSWKSAIDGSVVDLGNNAKLVYTIPSVGTTIGQLVDISVAISGTPKDTLTLPLDTTIHYTLYVYAQPVVSQEAYVAEMYEGNETTLSFSTTGGKDNAWSYVWENTDNITNNYTFKAASEKEYQIKVFIKNNLGNEYDFVDTLTYTIKVWDKCKVYQEAYPGALYVNDEVKLSFQPYGGKSGAWSYEWDNNGGSATSYTFKPTRAGDHQIKVLVKNTLGNADAQYDYTETLTYTIKVWNQCSVKLGGEDGLNCFTGQELSYSPEISGGDANNWTYEWYVDGEKQDVPASASSCVIAAPEVPENEVSKEVMVTLKVTNTPDSIYIPFTKTLNTTLKVWPVGKVSKSQIERIYYHGDTAYMAVNTQGGYHGGWTYKWTELGNTEMIGKEASCSVILTNTSPTKQTHTYQVEWKNAVENNVGSQGVDTIRLEVYAKVVAPTFSNEEIKMRDIDTRTISALVGAGGNPDGWSYEWIGATSTSGLSCTIAPEIASNVKDEKYIPIQLKWTNVGPNGKQWAEGVCEKVVHVYKTPANPVLKIKGNGTSNIFIVDDMGMTEEELWNKGYCFRFWDGGSLVEEVNAQRWCRYDHAPANAWVQSVWYYDDGFVCEGEAVTASVGYYSPSSKSTVCIYSMDGEFIVQTTVDEIDTLVNLYATLDAGLYIVKTENNGIVNTSKIVIR